MNYGTCEAVRPPRDGRLGFDPQPCGKASDGLRPMRSVRGGYATDPWGGTEPKFACREHLESPESPYAYEPYLY